MPSTHFTSVVFRKYKAFKEFHLSLQDFNVLAGPNNSGKSTIVSAFRILSEGMRRARARKPTPVEIRGYAGWGYTINLEGLPIAGENVFYNYDDSEPAEVVFRLSNGNTLRLHFPEPSTCYLVCDSKKKAVRTPSDFKQEFDIEIGFVPILGPVEHIEPLYQKEAARLALLSPGASRNFRNIWHHYPDDFDQFQRLIAQTWPGMEIQAPEIQRRNEKPILFMFCPEERYSRELHWAGYGFQVWAQMLTHIVKSKNVSLLVIDEPDIYLHSDLQRQLVSLLRELNSDILIATHSTEIISEVEPHHILIINKKQRSAKGIKDVSQLLNVFSVLGSNLNPILTQLAKTRRVIFVEGGDFQIFSAFARTNGYEKIANRSDFAIVPIDGFNPRRAIDLARGIEVTLGTKVAKAIILDRDYRSIEETNEICNELSNEFDLVHIHKRKEIENYLLDTPTIERVVTKKISDKAKRSHGGKVEPPDVINLLHEITEQLRADVFSQYLARRSDYLKRKNQNRDLATISAEVFNAFENDWGNFDQRLAIVPGKQVLSSLCEKLQSNIGVSISAKQIALNINPGNTPENISSLLSQLKIFSEKQLPD
jgi:energy-coupling factor transporter ATP-binding protein EcfA2